MQKRTVNDIASQRDNLVPYAIMISFISLQIVVLTSVNETNLPLSVNYSVRSTLSTE